MVIALFFSPRVQAAPGDLDLTFSDDGKQTTDFRLGVSSAAAILRQPDGKKVAVGSIGGNDFVLARYTPNEFLDTSFSGDGKQTTDFGTSFDDARGAALQDDGKIVVVGATGDGGFALARYNPSGTLDTSFSGDGKQSTDLSGSFSDGATAVAIQDDGKIVVAGAGNPFPSDFVLARYNPNGTLDTSFSGDGKQSTDFGSFDGASGVALQGDGKIVALGSAGFGDFALARYNPNGTLDTSFSGDGKQTTDFGGAEGAGRVAIQANGKIVAVGGGGPGQDFALARYNPNGSLDTSFSGDGKQLTDFGSDGDSAGAVALQGDGRIVAVGRSGGDNGDFALARYNPNGTLDTSFSGDGKQTTDFVGDNDAANGVVLQTNGKMVAAGTCGAGCDFALARYNPDGSLDPNFSNGGKLTTDFGGFSGDDTARGVAVQGNGKIVAAGAFGPNGFGLARYNPSGTLDSSFSGDGTQRTGFPAAENEANAVALQANGRIVAVGFSRDLHFGAFALARYNPNGMLDTSFSGDGKQTLDFGGTLSGDDGATGVAIQPDGKIVVVGFADFCDFALARYNPNGSLDTSFSGDGTQRTAFGGCGEGPTGVALQPDGKIVAVGAGGTGRDFALARYNPNGSLDTSFSGDGKQMTDFGGFDGASGIALQGDGKVVAAGLANGGAAGDFALARYNPNGSLDTSFSGDGKQTSDFGFGASDAANGLAIQVDGKVVAVGLAGGGATGDDFALARYNPNGALDPSFSGDGMRRTNFGPFDEANGVALQGDGKIIAAGAGSGPSQTNDFALARYLGG
jgi:uncharacterized delta-60 repeat protein